MNQYINQFEQKFTGAIEFFVRDIASLRTGRANPAILDNVQIEAYGAKSPINALANVAISDSASLVITPWDKNVAKDIEKAIITADLGLSVVNEGGKIRVSVPPLTEENRRELVKKLNAKLEDARVELRQVRDQVKTTIEKAFEDKALGEDDKFRFIKELDEYMSKKNEQLKELKDKKEKDIMTI